MDRDKPPEKITKAILNNKSVLNLSGFCGMNSNQSLFSEHSILSKQCNIDRCRLRGDIRENSHDKTREVIEAGNQTKNFNESS